MSFLLTALLSLTAAQTTPPPRSPIDGAWTILSVEKNGKTTEAYSRVTIRDSRLVINEGKGEKPITLELASNHVAWIWAGPNKIITVPAEEVWETDEWPDGGRGLPYKVTLSPARTIVLAQQGFYVEEGGLLHVYFLGDDQGPSLTLTLRRDSANVRANGRQEH
jgi:hypothetical protein